MRGHIAEKNGRYYTVISIKDPGTGKWKRKWLTGNKTKRKAERILAEAVAEVNKGMFIISSRETVAELCRNYLNTTASNRIRAVTLQSYRQMLEKSAQNPDEGNLVRNSLEEGDGVERRPYRSRTCGTLIKS